ncbi:hypothetical protein MMC17_005893 [Xylographa soralifera]|nr:hypothetical protein [Xylographa soralifera]
MSLSELLPSLASGSMAPGGTLSAPIDVDVDDHNIKQTDDCGFEEIGDPYVEEQNGPKDQHLEGPYIQQNQVPIVQHIEGPKGQQNEDPGIQRPEAPKSHGIKAPNVQQNQGPNAQQVACRRIRSKQPDAFKAVFEELRPIAERNAPNDRRKGVNVSHGLDIINHKKLRSGGQATLTQLGVVVVALRMLRKFEETLRTQPTESESTLHKDIDVRLVLTAMAIVNAFDSESTSLEIGGLIPFAAPSVSQSVTQPHVSCGLQVDPSGHADIIYTSTGIAPNAALEMPSDPLRVLVDKDYLMRIEKENELYRYHLRDLEMGVVRRLENGLVDALRRKQDKKPQEHKGLNSRNAGNIVKAQDVEISASTLKPSEYKGIYMLILKLPTKQSVPHEILTLRLQPKLLNRLTQERSAQAHQLYNAHRKRGTEEGDAQVTLVPAGVEAHNEEAPHEAKEELHIDKKMRFEEGPFK